VEKKI
jgi:hypothetical protein